MPCDFVNGQYSVRSNPTDPHTAEGVFTSSLRAAMDGGVAIPWLGRNTSGLLRRFAPRNDSRGEAICIPTTRSRSLARVWIDDRRGLLYKSNRFERPDLTDEPVPGMDAATPSKEPTGGSG